MRLQLGLEETEGLVHVPLIEIEYNDLSDPRVAQFFHDLEKYTHLVFTSPRTVDAFTKIAPIPDVPLFSVGKATTKRLLQEGNYSVSTAKEENQEGVLHQILLSDFRDTYIGIPCSARARASLSIGLGYRGIRHQIGPLYTTNLLDNNILPDLSEVKELHFTSPSTVDAFALHHSLIPGHIQCFVKGKSTADHLLRLFPRARFYFHEK